MAARPSDRVAQDAQRVPHEGSTQHQGGNQVDEAHAGGREEEQADRHQQQRVEDDLPAVSASPRTTGIIGTLAAA